MNARIFCIVAWICAAWGPLAQATEGTRDPLVVQAWTENLRAEAIDLIVRAEAVSGPPTLDLTFPDGVTPGKPIDHVEHFGDRTVITREMTLVTNRTRHTLDKLCASAPGAQPVCADPVSIDITGTLMPKEAADIRDPDPVGARVPWLGITLGVLLAALLGGLALRLWRRRTPREAPVPDVEPADILALRAWALVLQDESLSAYDRAEALAAITRRYTEAVLHIPASKWSTSETVAHLRKLDALPEDDVARVARLLSATDRVVYADATPGLNLFVSLDLDLREWVDRTRPQSLSPTPPEAP